MSTLSETFIMKINSIAPDESKFLQRLDTIAKPPKSLYFIGKIPETEVKTVAIVGTRKPTSYGKEVADRISRELSQAGILIVSGLALGIDGIAHRACIDTGGTTIAVLGNGLASIYPSSHKSLAENIIKSGGALLSEYAPTAPALPHQFLERNRLVSGLADAVIVVEAAAKSGTLSTAAHALEQGRDVFAVPGNITSPLSLGCNALIKQGATPLTSTQDVLDVLLPSHRTQTKLVFGDTPEEASIIELLNQGIRDGEVLQIKSKLDAMTFNQTLTMLEIKGIVKALGANQWTIK
jgi:DNA processing protein